MAERSANPIHRALRQFPGCRVVFAYDLCWPVLVLHLDVAVLTPQQASATALFILRLAKHGVIGLTEFASLLGMPSRMISAPLAELTAGGFLVRTGSTTFRITEDGGRLIESAGVTMRPQICNMDIPYDPICHNILDLEVADLAYSDDVAKNGRFTLPVQGSTPSHHDLHITEVRKYVGSRGPADLDPGAISSVVSVIDQHREVHRYRDDICVVALEAQLSRKFIFALYDDDGYLAAESSYVQGLWESDRRDIVPDEHRPGQGAWPLVSPWERSRSVTTDEILLLNTMDYAASIGGHLEQALVAAETSLQDTDHDDDHTELDGQIVELKAELAEVRDRFAAGERQLRSQTDGVTRLITTEEHRPLLVEAIQSASSQLTLVSAWIGPEAFDREICEKLSQALARGVRVKIAWGLGTTRGQESVRNRNRGENAIGELYRTIPRDQRHNLTVKRTETHEKFIICDDTFCAWGSFNWLSYRGELDRGYRRESSYYSERATDIDLWKANAASLFQ